MSTPSALPHGPLTKITDGVHVVRGSFAMGPGIRIGRTMTIVEAADGLVVLNAVRLSAEGEAALDRLGKIKHLVKLSDSHGVDEPYYAERYRPEVWAAEGAKLAGISATRRLGSDSPIAGGIVLDFPGTAGWLERAVLVPFGGGTLVTCDAVQNHADTEGTSFLGRMMTPLFGFKGGVIVAPMWRRYQKVAGTAVGVALAPILGKSFANLVTGHGPAVVGGALDRVGAAVDRASA